jgi:hypothetical protein
MTYCLVLYIKLTKTTLNYSSIYILGLGKFEDTKMVIRSRKSKKNRQHDGLTEGIK